LKVVFGLPMFSTSTEVAALLREKSIPVVILQLYVGNFPKFTVTVKFRKIRIFPTYRRKILEPAEKSFTANLLQSYATELPN
jgi:hypothetical protein